MAASKSLLFVQDDIEQDQQLKIMGIKILKEKQDVTDQAQLIRLLLRERAALTVRPLNEKQRDFTFFFLLIPVKQIIHLLLY